MKNFSRIAVLFISILWPTDLSTRNKAQSIQASQSKKDWDILSSISIAEDKGIDENIKNLSIITKLAKSKKPNLTKSKKSKLIKDFVRINSSETDFFTRKTKKTFIHL